MPHREIAAWSASRPAAVRWFDKIYTRLFDYMMVVSVFLAGRRLGRERVEYLGALGICYILGAFSYYLYPAAGPAFHDPGAYTFLRSQHLVTNDLQRLLYANTVAAKNGQLAVVPSYFFLACMPSLHMAHELVMLFYARRSRLFFAVSAAFSAVTLVAIAALGWHYPIDAAAGALLAAGAVAISRRCRAWLLPAALMPPPDPPG